VLEATLHNIANLRADFDAFGRLAETNSGETEKMSLLNDLNAAPQGTKPSQISVNKLAMNLANAVAGRDNMREQHTKLAQDVHAIFNCSHLSVEQEQDIFDDVQRILLTGGTTPDVVTNVVISVKAIAAETK
jgi:hypothetical protein